MIDCVEFGGDAVIAGLKEKFDEATRRNDVKALVLTGNLFYNTDWLFIDLIVLEDKGLITNCVNKIIWLFHFIFFVGGLV